MPGKSWSDKRDRQYEHIKEGLLKKGKPESLAKEISARTVNKERAQHGEARSASPTSLNDIPAPRRGGLRSRQGEGGRTLAQLRQEARDKGLEGRSHMNKADPEKALKR